MMVLVWSQLQWLGEQGDPQVAVGWAHKYVVRCYLDGESLSMYLCVHVYACCVVCVCVCV